MLCFCCVFNLRVMSKLGAMNWGGRGLGRWKEELVVVVTRGVGRGERRTEGTIGRGACSQLARVEVRGF